MVGYIYLTVTEDGCYYIGQHKRSEFNPYYFGSGKLLFGKKIRGCRMVDSADSISELNNKERYWIGRCCSKYGDMCINLGFRASIGSQKYVVNRKNRKVFYSIYDFAKYKKVKPSFASRWIYKYGKGSLGLQKCKRRSISKLKQSLITEWIYISVYDYMTKFNV